MKGQHEKPFFIAVKVQRDLDAESDLELMF